MNRLATCTIGLPSCGQRSARLPPRNGSPTSIIGGHSFYFRLQEPVLDKSVFLLFAFCQIKYGAIFPLDGVHSVISKAKREVVGVIKPSTVPYDSTENQAINPSLDQWNLVFRDCRVNDGRVRQCGRNFGIISTKHALSEKFSSFLCVSKPSIKDVNTEIQSYRRRRNTPRVYNLKVPIASINIETNFSETEVCSLRKHHSIMRSLPLEVVDDGISYSEWNSNNFPLLSKTVGNSLFWTR